jgi:hypothetical protein
VCGWQEGREEEGRREVRVLYNEVPCTLVDAREGGEAYS